MKYIKLLMFMAAVLPFFTSCSDDDDVNTAECTIGFESSQITVDETAGYVQIPITVSGRRNGPVHVTIESAPTGENAAVEGEHYVITDKTLNLNADTLSTSNINVEIKVIDDSEINEDRQFTLTITSVEGAELTISQTTVTIEDNDGDFYRAFAGTWTFNAFSLADNTQVSFPISIVAASEGSADYENLYTCEASNILGANEEYQWKFTYTFDIETLSGSIGLVCDDNYICSVQGYNLLWLLNPIGDSHLYEGILPAEWTLTEAGTIPTTLTFDQDYVLYLYADGAGWMDAYQNITLTR